MLLRFVVVLARAQQHEVHLGFIRGLVRAGFQHRHRRRAGRRGLQRAARVQAAVGRLHPGVGLAVDQHPDHVRAPQFQPGAARRQHRGAVGGQPHVLIGVAAAGGSAGAGRPVDGADLTATAVVPVDRDRVVVNPRHPTQVGVTAVAPARLAGGRVAPVDAPPVAGGHRPAHQHGCGGRGAGGRPQLFQGRRNFLGRSRIGCRDGGRAADGGPRVAGPPDQRRDHGHNHADGRRRRNVALGAAFGFDHPAACAQLAGVVAFAGLRRRRRRLAFPVVAAGDSDGVSSAATLSPPGAGCPVTRLAAAGAPPRGAALPRPFRLGRPVPLGAAALDRRLAG